ncbi:MAG: leucine-rich repeat domain-containing protein [Clostridia bacterium]|nr:leucine-rich repeat domain-containing protein [Clostridia bacterium]
MKKSFAVVLAVLMLVSILIPLGAFTASARESVVFTEGNFKYEVYDGEAWIVGATADLGSDIVIPSTLGGYPVVLICNIPGSPLVTSVTIPSTVESIWPDVFEDCIHIERVYISDFAAWCEIDFDYNAVTWYCSNPLASGAELYLNGEKMDLTNLVIPDGVEKIGDYAFISEWDMIEGVIETVEIPSSVTSIGQGAFCYCAGIKSIIIPDSVKFIGDNAFNSCSKLEQVTLSENIGYIEDYLFYDCTSLRSVNIPQGVKTICEYAFARCHSLENVTIPDTVEKIEEGAFGGAISLKSITIPDSVTEIERFAFYGCKSLESVTLSPNVEFINGMTFAECESLKSVEIPHGVLRLHDNVFENCKSLTSVTFPSSVRDIGEEVFLGCDNVVICCDKDDYAYEYAVQNGIKTHCDNVEQDVSVPAQTYDWKYLIVVCGAAVVALVVVAVVAKKKKAK